MKKLISLAVITAICLSLLAIPSVYGASEAQITSHSDGEWLDPYKAITVKWSTPGSGYNYKITIKNRVTGFYVTQNESVSGNSYTIKSNTLDFEQSYIIWVGTYSGNSPMGQGHSVTVNMYDRLSSAKVYDEASFTYPSNNQTVSPDENLTLKIDGNSDLAYVVSVKNLDTGKSIVNNEYISSNSYTIPKSKLIGGHTYKAWVGSYKKNSAEKGLFGVGNSIEFRADAHFIIEEFVEAGFISPSNGDILDASESNRIRFCDISSGYVYRISVLETDTNNKLIDNEIISGSTYTISANTLNPGMRYKIWVGTYRGDSLSAAVGIGNTIYINTKDEEIVEMPPAVQEPPVDGDGKKEDEPPIEISSLTADMNDNFLLFEYEVTGDDFKYVQVTVKTASGDVVLDTEIYENECEIDIPIDELEEGEIYICELTAYNLKNQKCASRSIRYEVAESGFSAREIEAPDGNLYLGEEFNIDGIIGSAYPIDEARIAVYFDGDLYTPAASYVISDYNKNNLSISDYSTRIKFHELPIGEYIYQVTVTDIMGNTYTAVESDFSVIREAGVYDDVTSSHANYEAIKELSVDGVISGDGNGSFRPDSSITRAEFVKIICEAFGVRSTSGYSPFTDIKNHWAESYIKKVYNYGLVNGTSETTFSPNNNVTYEQAAKIVVCLIGAENLAVMKGGWPAGYVAAARELNLFDKTDIYNHSWSATRAHVAQMVYNALSSNLVVSSGGTMGVDLSDSSIYFKQTQKYCTLDAMAVVFRRRAVLDGNMNYESITENSMINKGNWVSGGLTNAPKYVDSTKNLNMSASSKRLNFQVKGNQYTMTESPDAVKSTLKSMLDTHPEGIVLYVFSDDMKWMHAVTLTDYNGDVFYCADPATGDGIIPLMESSLTDSRHAKANNIDSLLSNCVKIWWVSSYDNI